VKVGPIPLWPKPLLLVKGLKTRPSGQRVIVRTTIGFFGFVAGPHVHIIDIWALSDPFLARLPALPGWRIGHFERHIPAGYIETLESGKNIIRDKRLALYYSKLREVTRSPLFNSQRWIDIWKLNTGAYGSLLGV
jgi:arabinofuranosyltransferase